MSFLQVHKLLGSLLPDVSQIISIDSIFFDANKYPISVLDTKKFSYENEESVLLNIELTIKGISKIIPVNLKVSDYSEDFVQLLENYLFLAKDKIHPVNLNQD